MLQHPPAPALLLALLAAAGCSPGSSDSGEAGPEDTDGTSGPGFSVMTEAIQEGVLLSAWSDGGEALMVGGELGREGLLARYDGQRLCVESGVTDGALWWIHGPREGEWYAVGDRGIVLHEQDGVRSREDVPTDMTLFGVYAAEDEVWAVGGDALSNTGEIWRRRDGAWSLFAGELPGLLFKTWEGWFVGSGLSYRLDGEELVEVDAGGARLVTVRGRDPDSDVWAVGGGSRAEIYRFQGQRWELFEDHALSQPLNGVWTAPGEPVYVAGNGGTSAFYLDDQWVAPDFPATMEVLHAVWPYGDEVLWVGGNLLSSSGDYYGAVVRYGEDSAPLEPEVCP